jgi:hypothetical protein
VLSVVVRCACWAKDKGCRGGGAAAVVSAVLRARPELQEEVRDGDSRVNDRAPAVGAVDSCNVHDVEERAGRHEIRLDVASAAVWPQDYLCALKSKRAHWLGEVPIVAGLDANAGKVEIKHRVGTSCHHFPLSVVGTGRQTGRQTEIQVGQSVGRSVSQSTSQPAWHI